MPIYKLIEDIGNHLEATVSLWKYYKSKSSLHNAGVIVFDDNTGVLFKLKKINRSNMC